MSIGLYVLPVNGLDLQKPHQEDEAYYMIRGHAQFKSGNEDYEVSAGTMIYVGKGVEHCFHDITEPLEALVFFAPPETYPPVTSRGDTVPAGKSPLGFSKA
jgi:mannose-6-phosphate isomerase-like protein (cupin superfamily)